MGNEAQDDEEDSTYGFDPSNFDGIVRLFPLPDFVLFPHIVRGLHIFEPRYCAMLEEALRTDNLIAMATLSAGWQHLYAGSPPIFSAMCIGKIVHHETTRNGCHNILLRGVERAFLCEEISNCKSFRTASVEVVRDIRIDFKDKQIERNVNAIIQRFLQKIPAAIPNISLQDIIDPKIFTSLSLSEFGYLLASHFPIAVPLQLDLLSETNPLQRLEILESWLDAILKCNHPNTPTNGTDEDDSPSHFSDN